jgi:F0F1-type ATP synthase membrane subunit b/b'
MVTNAELTECIRGLERAEDIVERTFRNAPDDFNKRMAQTAIALSRKHLEEAIDIHLSLGTSD